MSEKEIARYGRFAVVERGESFWPGEWKADRPPYAVIEHDEQGPILRAGPFHDLAIAIETAQQFNFRAELTGA